MMTQFKSFAHGVEVNGQTVYAVVAGMGNYREFALKILASHGIENPVPGMWYSQQAWLDAFKTIAEKIGSATLFQIGKSIPAHADWSSSIETITDALYSIDVAYHMNHRIDGKILYNASTGRMKEGIGHYAFEPTGERHGRMTCKNPYPCEFDRGIIEAVAKKFRPADSLLLEVEHAHTPPCRMKGDEECEYLISW